MEQSMGPVMGLPMNASLNPPHGIPHGRISVHKMSHDTYAMRPMVGIGIGNYVV